MCCCREVYYGNATSLTVGMTDVNTLPGSASPFAYLVTILQVFRQDFCGAAKNAKILKCVRGILPSEHSVWS
jgi:hypothetical protein